MLTRTGEVVRKSGIYVSQCCGYQAGLLADQEYPVCGHCGRPTDWLAITPDESVTPGGLRAPPGPGDRSPGETA